MLYETLKAEYKTNAFDANILLCKKKLNNEFIFSTSKSEKELLQTFSEPILTAAQTDAKTEKNKICLIRIIGNDLPGLHDEYQTLNNLEFILKNELSFDGVDKIFFINRIVSKEKNEKIRSLLNKYECSHIEEKFNPREFIDIPWNTKDMPGTDYLNSRKISERDILFMDVVRRNLRNAYLMNNNGARNSALEFGYSEGYDWVLPFDGNCFFSEKQIKKLHHTLDEAKEDIEYLIFPMERCLENTTDLATKDATAAVEEPQIGFRRGAALYFDANRVYGNQPKVDLLKRLGVPGVWDTWKNESPWKPMVPVKPHYSTRKWVSASSVFRLASGNVAASTKLRARLDARLHAIVHFIDEVHDYSCKTIKNNSIIDFQYYKKSLNMASAQPDQSGVTRSVNDFFDRVYLINLKKETEKKLKVQKQMMQLGIDCQVFSAINGYAGEPAKKYQEYIKRPLGDLKIFSKYSYLEKKRNTKLIESAGAVGCIFTFMEIIKDAKKNKFKNILIFEDDVIFANNFGARFDAFSKKLPSDWKILLLGASQYGWKSVDVLPSLAQGFYHPRIHATKGAFALGLNESIYDELIANQMAFEAPFDNLPIGVLYEKYLAKCFVAFPYLVMPDVSVSTIRGKRDQYEHANRMKWWVGDFCYPQRRPNVGIILNSKRNIKYLNQRNLFDSAPFNANFFYVTNNGLQPLHNFSLINENYSGNFSETMLKDVSISVDILLEAHPKTILTIEAIQDAVEKIFARRSPLDGFNKLDIDLSRVVDSRASVILTTYKRPAHLAKAIESVLLQDYQDVELVVVDDNGKNSEFSDTTKQIVDAYKNKFPPNKLKYIQHKSNANGSAARNTGIFHSTGGYICFLDDDDLYLQGRVSKSVAVLEHTNDDVGGSYCGFLGWNSNGPDEKRFAAGDLTKELLTLDYKRHYVHTNTITFKRSAIFRINGFDTSYKRHQDIETNVRFLQHYKFDVVKDCLVRLKPEATDVDNKIYGLDMFHLKNKFLNEFKHIINSFDEETKKRIYMNHWDETVRYAKDRKELVTHLRNDFSNSALQIVTMVETKK